MGTVEKYEALIRLGLVVPQPDSPLNFKFPSLLVYVPSITTDHVIDPARVKRTAASAKLERNSK
jgi:hypothetical protein